MDQHKDVLDPELFFGLMAITAGAHYRGEKPENKVVIPKVSEESFLGKMEKRKSTSVSYQFITPKNRI